MSRHKGEGLRWILPLALYCVLATLYLFAIPTGESPDEPSHLQCIEQVTRFGRPPIIDPLPLGSVWWARERIISGLVCAHMPLYYFVAGSVERLTARLTGTNPYYIFPPNNPAWQAGSPAMFVHDDQPSALARPGPPAILALRILSMLLGPVALFGAWRVALALSPATPAASEFAAVLVAGWPQFLFMSRAINNDGLATALAVGVLVVLVTARRRERYLAAAGLAVLAVLTKLTMMFLWPVIGLTWGFEAWQQRRNREFHSAHLRAFAGVTAVGAVLIALLSFHPALRADLAWSRSTMLGFNSAALTVPYLSDVLQLTLVSGWATFGWMNVPAPAWQAYAWWLLLAGAGSLGAIATFRRLRNNGPALPLFVVAVWFVGVVGVYLWIQFNRFQPQFRYAFALVPVLAGLAGIGLAVLLEDHPRLRGLALVILAVGLFLANAWLIFGVVMPSYWP